MQTYRYRALRRTGEMTSGEIVAADPGAVVAHLHALGLVPLAAEPIRPNALPRSWTRDVFARHRLSGKALAGFVQQLASLAESGVAIEQALAIVARNRAATSARRAAEDLLERLRAGAMLSDAMRAASGTFPPIAVGMARAGEAAGSLDLALSRLAQYLKRSDEVRQSIYSALVYPAMLVLTAFLSVTIILTVVIPQLEPLFVDSGAVLPLPTRVVIAASEALRNWWWAMVLVSAAGALILQRLLADVSVKQRLDRALLQAPLIGPAIRRAEAARFARTLGTLAGANVPLPTALALAIDVLVNRHMAGILGRVAGEMKEGGGLGEPLARAGVLPELSIDFIRIGEATGRLDDMLVKLAELFEGEVQRQIERALSLLVPLITILMGMAVAGIVASVLVAILGVNDLAM